MSERKFRTTPNRPHKKLYEPPRVLAWERLETAAVDCSPAPPAKGDPGMCPMGPISS